MEYPKTITLKDEQHEVLLSMQDFEYLIDHYMGFEALRFFRELREESEAEIRELVEENNNLRNELTYLRSKLREEGVSFDE